MITFFEQGNLDSNDKLVFAEFCQAYSDFIYFLIGRQVDFELLLARFELADFASNTNTVDLTEFAFLVTMDLKFVYDNYSLFIGDTSILCESVKKIEMLLIAESFSQAFGTVFSGFDLDKDFKVSPAEFRSGLRILGYIIGINFDYKSGLLNDLFNLADINKDSELSYTEATTFISAHLNEIKGILHIVSDDCN